MIYFELFATFFLIGLFTFGGGYAMIPMIQEQVISKGWMTSNELTDFVAISECTPGTFAINISTFVGARIGGFFGAVCTTIGVIAPSFIIIIIVAFVMKKFIKNRFVQKALATVRPIIIALILSTAILFFSKAVFFNGHEIFTVSFSFDRSIFAIIIGILIYWGIYKFKYKKSLNPLMILLISGVCGLIVFY